MTSFIKKSILFLYVLAIGVPSVLGQNDRLTVFISDTHFGVGKVSDGKWHAYEDARWTQDFTSFLGELNRQGQGTADLVLNGDTFELWQSLQNDCIYLNKNLGCTEAEALNRLRVVLAAHRSELDAIRTFAVAGNNTVTIVPGNHDAALAFPKVAAEVLRAINAPADRVKIPTNGYWLSSDSLLYAEHGHQIGNDMNLFSKWPNPFLVGRGVSYLQRPWGEQFVQRFYNQFEVKYPILDNVMGDFTGLRYGFEAEGPAGFVIDLGKFLYFDRIQSSYAQRFQFLGARTGPAWDVAAIRKRGDRFLVESLANDDPLRIAAEKSLNERSLGFSASLLSNEEIQSICNLRAAMIADDTANRRQPRVTACPQKTLGGLVDYARARDSIFRKHLETTLARLRQVGSARPFSIFVFSHTHLPESSYAPFEGSGTSWRPIVVNTGAWQRTISEEELNRYINERNLKVKDVLQLEPEILSPCYPVIMVPPYSSTPQSTLSYWKQSGGTWLWADGCD